MKFHSTSMIQESHLSFVRALKNYRGLDAPQTEQQKQRELGRKSGRLQESQQKKSRRSQLKQELEEKSTAVTELEEEMEGIKEEVQTHNTRPLIRAQR